MALRLRCETCKKVYNVSDIPKNMKCTSSKCTQKGIARIREIRDEDANVIVKKDLPYVLSLDFVKRYLIPLLMVLIALLTYEKCNSEKGGSSGGNVTTIDTPITVIDTTIIKPDCLIGSKCNDDNGNTINDVIIDSLCTCKGVQVKIIYDCPDLKKNMGDDCNDRDGNTNNDIVTSNCNCRGTAKKIMHIWYADNEPDGGDGLGDPSDTIITYNNISPSGGNWVSNADDECPTRKGNSSNGCPTLSISSQQNTTLINQKTELIANLQYPKGGDRYEWTSKAKVESKTSKSTFLSHPYVEKIKVNLNVENASDNFQINETKTIHFKVTEKQLVDYLVQLAEFGNYAMRGRTEDIEKGKVEADLFFKNSIQSDNIKLRKTNRGIVVNKNSFKDFKLELLTPKRSIDTKIDITNLKVSNIEYDSTSGNISTFKYSY